MKKLKVVTVVGTRPEIIRLSCTIAKLDQFCDHVLVHTGQNYDYELNQIFFEDLGIRAPDIFLECAGDTAADDGDICHWIVPSARTRQKTAILDILRPSFGDGKRLWKSEPFLFCVTSLKKSLCARLVRDVAGQAFDIKAHTCQSTVICGFACCQPCAAILFV